MEKREKKFILITIIYLAFISLGLPDGILGVSWSNVRSDFDLPLSYLGIITVITSLCGAFSSFKSGKILAKYGTGKVTLVSCILTGLGLLFFAFSQNFYWLMVLAIPLGLGAGCVDTGLNNFVANHYSAKHMNWLHCFWGLGASLGTFIMTLALSNYTWRIGYIIIGSIQLTIALILFISVMLKFWKLPSSINSQEEGLSISAKKLYRKKDQLASMAIFFVYTGIEFSMAAWITSVLVEGYGVPLEKAGLVSSSFYFSIMIGRFLSGIVVDKIGNKKMIFSGIILAFIGILVMMVFSPYFLKLSGAIFYGLGLAPIFPCLVHETPRRFTKEVSQNLIGYQVGSAALGSMVISFFIGLILGKINILLFFPIILFFAVIMLFLNGYLESKVKLLNK